MPMTRMHESLRALKSSLEDLGTRIKTVTEAIDAVIEHPPEQPERSPERHPDPPPPDHGHP